MGVTMIDVVQGSALHELVKSPLYELGRGSGPMQEEVELLIETSNTPSAIGADFVEQNPSGMISAANNLSWSLIPDHTPYSRTYTEYRQANGPYGSYSIFAQGWVGINVQLNGWDIFPIAPPPTQTFAGINQHSYFQFGMWQYDPNGINQGGVNQFLNSVYAHRSRWRASKPVQVWTAKATLYSSYNAPDLIHNQIFPYGDTGTAGNIVQRMITSAKILQQPFTLSANTWLEMPNPSADVTPNRNSGVIGQLWFAVHTETPAAWSTRTGVSFV